MADQTNLRRGRPRKTVAEALRKQKDGKPLTRAERQLLRAEGERIGLRDESGVAYATQVAAEWEAQFIRGGVPKKEARREAARYAVEALKYLQDPKTQARMADIKPIGGRVFKATTTIYDIDLATGELRPVSELENARDCGDEVPDLLSGRTTQGSNNQTRSLMDKIMRRLASKSGQRARDAAKRTAGMGELGSKLQSIGEVGRVTLRHVRPGRKPKNDK
ncbi:MAG: hypothetical protein IOC54_09915 [Methylobacterium sp.]|nr:hypothetical protein [Methylobacterium sp.]MCA4921974.1 hypothetical protein [Methylobacterium sp.]